MNFYKTLGLKNSRIDVADALRGLAVAGIILFHSVEHFNMWDGSITHPYALACDDEVAGVMALLLSGKMYGIFALLFGLSFFIMNDNQQQKGRCFSGRFAWRMFLLALLGIVNTAFFDGDILFSYAIYGLLLIPLSYLPSKYLWGVVAFLFVQPIEIYSLLTGGGKWICRRWGMYMARWRKHITMVLFGRMLGPIYSMVRWLPIIGVW